MIENPEHTWIILSLSTLTNVLLIHHDVSSLVNINILKPGTVLLWPRTHWRQSRKDVQHSGDKVDRFGDNVDREFKLLPICCQNRHQSRPYTASVDFVADLSPVSATVDFQESRPCWIHLCRQSVPGLRLRQYGIYVIALPSGELIWNNGSKRKALSS